MDLDVLIRSDEGAVLRRIQLDGVPLSIGRTPECSLYLPSDCISRLHALVHVEQDGLRVEDRSSNGTLVGNVHLHRNSMEVPFGTTLTVGEYTLSVGPPGTVAVGDSGEQPASANTPATFPIHPQSALAQTGANPAAHQWDGPTSHGHEPLSETAMSAQPLTVRGAPQGSGAAHSAPPHGPPTHSSPPRPQSQPPKVVLAAQAQPQHPLAGHHQGPASQPPSSVLEETASSETRDRDVALRRDIHAKLLENLDLAKLDASKLDDPSMRPRVLTALRRIVQQLDARIDPTIDRNQLVGELADEALGLGPLERFLSDPAVSEIMVVDPDTIYVESGGRLVKSKARFTDDERVRAVIERIVTPLGRRIDESSPLVDARLKDGSRVNAVIKPLALRGSCITIRKFAREPLTVDNLIGFGSLTERMARFMARTVIARKNVLISGGTGSGKTTLLNVLSGSIPNDERIVTIEDAAELQLPQPHVVPLESRPPNMEGRGEYTIRDLVKNSLRMRPDRIVVGECRGGEALDMLQAMNTGHDGSLTTTHANSCAEAVARIETLALMAGLDLPARAVREQIASSIHVVVQTGRLSDGSRRISAIAEVVGMDEDETIELHDIFTFVRTGTGPNGRVLGEHRATGYLPSFLDEFIIRGLVKRGEPYL